MFRKLREALKKQRYRGHSDEVALPEVHTGPEAFSTWGRRWPRRAG